jgi:hypothetical protein
MHVGQTTLILVLAFALSCIGCQKRSSPSAAPGTTIGDASEYASRGPRERPLELIYSVELVVERASEDQAYGSACYLLVNVVTHGQEDLGKTCAFKFGSREFGVSQVKNKLEEAGGRLDQALRVELDRGDVDQLVVATEGLVSFGGTSAVVLPPAHLGKIRAYWQEVSEGKRNGFVYVIPRSEMKEKE